MAKLIQDWLASFAVGELDGVIAWASSGVKRDPDTRFLDDGSNFRSAVSFGIEDHRCLQILKVIAIEDTFEAIVSDGVTRMNAIFSQDAYETLKHEIGASIGEQTVGDVFTLLEARLNMTLFGSSQQFVLIYVDNIQYEFHLRKIQGHPDHVERREDVKLRLQQIREIRQAAEATDGQYFSSSQDLSSSRLVRDSLNNVPENIPFEREARSQDSSIARISTQIPERTTLTPSFLTDGLEIAKGVNLAEPIAAPGQRIVSSKLSPSRTRLLSLMKHHNQVQPNIKPVPMNLEKNGTDQAEIHKRRSVSPMARPRTRTPSPEPPVEPKVYPPAPSPNSRAVSHVPRAARIDYSRRRVPRTQREILDRPSSWFPPLPGNTFISPNVPLALLTTWKQNSKASPTKPKEQPPSPENPIQSSPLATADDLEMSDTELPLSQWSISSPIQPDIPPNSSGGYPAHSGPRASSPMTTPFPVRDQIASSGEARQVRTQSSPLSVRSDRPRSRQGDFTSARGQIQTPERRVPSTLSERPVSSRSMNSAKSNISTSNYIRESWRRPGPRGEFVPASQGSSVSRVGRTQSPFRASSQAQRWSQGPPASASQGHRLYGTPLQGVPPFASQDRESYGTQSQHLPSPNSGYDAREYASAGVYSSHGNDGRMNDRASPRSQISPRQHDGRIVSGPKESGRGRAYPGTDPLTGHRSQPEPQAADCSHMVANPDGGGDYGEGKSTSEPSMLVPGTQFPTSQPQRKENQEHDPMERYRARHRAALAPAQRAQWFKQQFAGDHQRIDVDTALESYRAAYPNDKSVVRQDLERLIEERHAAAATRPVSVSDEQEGASRSSEQVSGGTDKSLNDLRPVEWGMPPPSQVPAVVSTLADPPRASSSEVVLNTLSRNLDPEYLNDAPQEHPFHTFVEKYMALRPHGAILVEALNLGPHSALPLRRPSSKVDVLEWTL